MHRSIGRYRRPKHEKVIEPAGIAVQADIIIIIIIIIIAMTMFMVMSS